MLKEEAVYGQIYDVVAENYRNAGKEMEYKKSTFLLTAKSHPQEVRVADFLELNNPEFFQAYSGWGADLTLSGHYHGGFMRLPLQKGLISPKYQLFPKYAGGLIRGKHCCMIVSRGLGMHTLPLRIFNPGELAVIDLKRMPK